MNETSKTKRKDKMTTKTTVTAALVALSSVCIGVLIAALTAGGQGRENSTDRVKAPDMPRTVLPTHPSPRLVVEGKCVHVAKDGILIQQYETVPTYASAGSRNWGGLHMTRTFVASEEKVPTKKLFLKHYPDMKSIAVGHEVSVLAIQVAPVDVKGERTECWDCGTAK